MEMRMPEDARRILERLREEGFDAYAVGGCVRDSLLGRVPKDWDICTAATPEEMQRVFRGEHVVETGLKHGTLTVVLHHQPYEVTTFRVDGEYSDHRHPDGVTFVRDVREDLARRDFTVNAMAVGPDGRLVDCFGGQEDLAAGVIRCVGEAGRRFEEDALRILRALRFASTYDFSIDPDTSSAIHQLYPTLKDVAAERIRIELAKMLCGVGAGRILRDFADVIVFVLPEMRACIGFDQHSRHHRWDVWEHSVRACELVPANETMRMAALLHDAGKPSCFTLDELGEGHMYGHPRASRDLAEQTLVRLKMDNATRDRVLLLVEKHDLPLEDDRRMMNRRLSQLGEEALRQLIDLQAADRLATGRCGEEEAQARRNALLAALDEVLAEDPCVSVKDLAVGGAELARAGFPRGPLMGACLRAMLDAVIAGETANSSEALLAWAGEWLTENRRD